MPTRVILDTDIGTDVDDCLVIALLLACPEIELAGITCVYGDVALRARLVRKLLRLAGRERECPVLCGVETPMTLVPLDVTTLVQIDREMVAGIRGAGTPFHDAVAGQVEAYPRFVRDGATALHDPLAAAIVVRPDLVTLTPAHIEVELTGRITTAATVMTTPTDANPATADVALRVAVDAATAFIGERLASRKAIAH